MPFILEPVSPESIGVGRTARNVTYRADDLTQWAAEVDEVLAGERELTPAEFADVTSANLIHNAALEALATEAAEDSVSRAELAREPPLTNDEIRALRALLP